jgi:adenosylhomocysteine nucleosidase
MIIRAISDKADEETVISYDEFEGKAAEHCAKIVEYMITNIHA